MGSLGQTYDAPDTSIGHAVAHQVNKNSRKVAVVVNEHTTMTYEELHVRAQALASTLIRDGGLASEDIVGILTRHGAEQIVAQLAVVYAGGTCLALDDSLSDDDTRTRLGVAKTKHLLIDRTGWPRKNALSVDNVFVVDLKQEMPALPHGIPDLPRAAFPDYQSHIFFTSGTTGKPKAVQVPGQGILGMARDPCWGRRVGDQRFGHMTSAGFDASILDVWVPLINGATIVVLKREQGLSPELLERSLRAQRVTTLWMTASLFGIVAAARPSVFSGLDNLFIGGESPSLDACRAVLETAAPRRLVNGYGPTECSVLSTWHEITLADVERGFLPIGKPFRQTKALVLDDSFRPVVDQQAAGELFIGGPGLSRGYLRNEEKTHESFLSVTVDGRRMTLYRTRDSVYKDDLGRLVWAGRKDREVKVRGYRVRLDVVEAELLLTGLVGTVAAMKIQPPGTNTSLLVACVTYKKPSRNDRELLARAKDRLPSYMVPRLVRFERLPVNRNGKIDRARLAAELMELLRNRHDKTDAIDKTWPDAAATPTESKLRALWSRILVGVPAESMQRDADFVGCGASSIDMASLTTGIRELFDVQLPTRTIYEHLTLADMATCIDQKRRQTFAEHVEEIKTVLRHDANTLSDEVPIPKGAAVDWRAADQGQVFVTGSTGFVAAHLLAQLLPLPETKTVLCLVRAGSADAARGRILANLAKYRLEAVARSFGSKIEVVLGDFSKPRLGLGEAQFSDLANRASVVYHLGAQVNYNQPYESHRAANVLGTLHVLQLAAAGQVKAVHYTSSVSAFGPTGLANSKQPDEIREDMPLTAFLETTIPYETGYGQSQWVVEEIVASLIRRGFPITIYRLGFVLCSSRDGVGNPDDFVGRLLVDCLELGDFPLLPNQRKELLPADYAASAILRISASNDNLGRAYHITPAPGTAMDMNDVFGFAGSFCGAKLRGVAYQDWLRNLKKSEQEGAELRLGPLMPMLEEKVYGGLTRWEIYDNMAGFCVDQTVEALMQGNDGQVFKPPAVDEDILQRYLVTLGLGKG